MSQTASGILLLDKPGLETLPSAAATALPTSHDMVRHVRRCLGLKRVGHTGTLDPFASGLLVLCIGKATRLAEYYQDLPKTYIASIRLGTETTTDDVTGDIVGTMRPVTFRHDVLERHLQSFLGPQEQVPPVYSAKKVQGQRAYKLARAGADVALPPAPVHIHELHVVQPLHEDRITLRITCSAGTYIRSLARDLGRVLGVGGCLTQLRRVALGQLHVDRAWTPEQVTQQGQTLVPQLLAPGTGLLLPRIVCDATARQHLGQGRVIHQPLPAGGSEPGALALAVDEHGACCGVLTCAMIPGQDALKLKARKWLAPV